MKHPLLEHSENLWRSTDEMNEFESVLGLKNLGQCAKIYEKYHHLFQLLETTLLLKEEIDADYSASERKAYKKGLFSILRALEKCFLESEEKIAKQKEV